MSMERTMSMQREFYPGWSKRLCIPAVMVVLACVMPAELTAAKFQPASTAPKQVQAASSQAAVVPAADRQKALQADAAHLLQLATELKANVDRTRRDELSLRVIREADEIERLARAARSRIR